MESKPGGQGRVIREEKVLVRFHTYELNSILPEASSTDEPKDLMDMSGRFAFIALLENGKKVTWELLKGYFFRKFP